MSAFCSSVSASLPCSGANAIPMLVPTLTLWPPRSRGCSIKAMILRASHRAITLVLFVFLNDREFIAAQTRHHVGIAKRGLQAPRDLDEQQIAGGVSQRIVDVLE